MSEAYDLLTSQLGRSSVSSHGERRPVDGRGDDARAPAGEPDGSATAGRGSSGRRPIDDAERERRKQALDELFELMRPAVQADGGDLAVVDVDYDTGVVEVELQGACGSCAISAVTLQGGVERLLERAPGLGHRGDRRRRRVDGPLRERVYGPRRLRSRW